MNVQTVSAVSVVLVVAGLLWNHAREYAYPSNVFPELVFAIIALLSVVLIIIEISKGRPKRSGKIFNEIREYLIELSKTIGLTLVYIIVITTLGFYLSSFLFLVVMFIIPVFRERNIDVWHLLVKVVPLRIGIAFGLTAVVYGCFRLILLVPTPNGILL